MEKYIEFQRDGNMLRGMLHLPENSSGKPPVVLILHGFGGDRNAMNFSLTKLSRRLAANGVASARFDFSACGESDGETEDMTISSHIADGAAMIDFVSKLDEVDTSRLGLFGLSIGGAIASAVAAQKKEEVKTLCLCCPATNSVDDAANKRVKGKDISDIFIKGYCDLDGMKLGKCFYDDALTINFYELAKGYNKNVMLIHGDKDFIAPLENSHKFLKLYGTKARLTVVEGADHSFTSLETNEKRLSTAVEYFVSEFL